MDENTYILNDFKEASLCYYIYEVIKSNNGKFKIEDDIAEYLDLKNDLVDRVVDALLFFELVEKRQDKFYVIDFHMVSENASYLMNFKLYMLNIFRKKIGDEGNWKKNAANFLILEYMIKKNQIILNNDKINQKSLDLYFEERGYLPYQSGTTKIIYMNSNKLNNWCEIFQFLGCVKKIPGNAILLNIDSEMFEVLIETKAKENNDQIILLKDFIEWINKNYFIIPLAGRKVPEIICKILYSLCRRNIIKLLKKGNRNLMDLINKPLSLDIPEDLNAIRYIKEET